MLEPILIISDAHVPAHSRVWFDLLLQVGKAVRPKHLVIIGDFADCYGISAHDKDPELANHIADEMDAVNGCLDQLDALGAKDKLYIEGNHEDRIRRYVQKHPELRNVLTIPKLLRLRERKWQYVPYKDHAKRGCVHYTHDVGASGQNAVYKALALYQHSVVSGHNHRAALIVEGSAVGDCKISATFGWGGDVEQVDYTNRANARKSWALAFGLGYLDPATGYTYLQMIPVVHGSVCVNGRVYRSKLRDKRPRRAA